MNMEDVKKLTDDELADVILDLLDQLGLVIEEGASHTQIA